MLFDLILPIIAGLVFASLFGYAGFRMDEWMFKRRPISGGQTIVFGAIFIVALVLVVLLNLGLLENPRWQVFVATCGVCALLWIAAYTVKKVFLKSSPEDPKVAKRRRRLEGKVTWVDRMLQTLAGFLS